MDSGVVLSEHFECGGRVLSGDIGEKGVLHTGFFYEHGLSSVACPPGAKSYSFETMEFNVRSIESWDCLVVISSAVAVVEIHGLHKVRLTIGHTEPTDETDDRTNTDHTESYPQIHFGITGSIVGG